MDEAALVQALESGKAFSCGLDVYENEPDIHPGLLQNPHVMLVPHMGTWTYEVGSLFFTLVSFDHPFTHHARCHPGISTQGIWIRAPALRSFPFWKIILLLPPGFSFSYRSSPPFSQPFPSFRNSYLFQQRETTLSDLIFIFI